MNRLHRSLSHAKQSQNNRLTQNQPGFVYFIHCQGFTKIGIATNPRLRIATLRVGCPYPIQTLRIAYVQNMSESEHVLHKLMKQFHHQGEWFLIPPDLLNPFLTCSAKDFQKLLKNQAL